MRVRYVMLRLNGGYIYNKTVEVYMSFIKNNYLRVYILCSQCVPVKLSGQEHSAELLVCGIRVQTPPF